MTIPMNELPRTHVDVLGEARLVKLDGRGQPLWDLHSGGDGDLDTPLSDQVELLPDGSISLTGRIYPARNVKKAWSAVVSAGGKVVSDVVGE